MEKQTLATVASAEARGDEPEIVISTVALDRADDEVMPEGGDFAAYLRNPVVLFGHDHHGLPVGSTTRLDVVPGRGIRARWRWLEGDAFAGRVRNAWEAGVLRAASIGFIPRASEPNGRGGRRFTRWELLEWSLCAVPANPEAVRTLKALDLWSEDGDVLDLLDDPGELVDFDCGDFAAAFRETVPALIREAVDAAVRREAAGTALRHGEPFGDPFARHHGGGPSSVEHAEVARAVREVVPALVRRELESVIAREVGAVVARTRGRVD